MNQLQSIIKKIFNLKPLAPVAHKVMALARDPDSSVSDLADIISYDAALTANLLKMANSSYFGRREKIDTVNQACAFLGMDQIVDLVFMTSSAENLAPAHAGYDLDKGELWKNSVSSALIARELAEKEEGRDVHLIFTAALLKDIGKVVLNQYVADAFAKIDALVTQQGVTFKTAEKEVLGIDHAELGAVVAKTWRFSSTMQDIIRNHHQPGKATVAAVETAIVYMADTLCMMMGVGVGSDGLAYRFDPDVAELLQLSERDIEKIMAGFAEKHQQVETLLSFS